MGWDGMVTLLVQETTPSLLSVVSCCGRMEYGDGGTGRRSRKGSLVRRALKSAQSLVPPIDRRRREGSIRLLQLLCSALVEDVLCSLDTEEKSVG